MDLVKEDYLLGNKKIIVGDKLHELVLESVGKIYIKQGSGYKDFSSLLSSSSSSQENPDKTVIEPDGIKSPETYKSGQFVFDSSTKTLYFKYDTELISLIQYNEESEGDYVSKNGDTMKGQLEIQTQPETSPLNVTSTQLNKNFNAEYVGGKKLSDLTQKSENETVSGNWNFKESTSFKVIEVGEEFTSNGIANFQNKVNVTEESDFSKTATFRGRNGVSIKIDFGDIVTAGNIQSENFKEEESGWKIDNETNTLVIDNVVIKNDLKVLSDSLEKSSGTNESLWITDNLKIEQNQRIIYLTQEYCEQLMSQNETADRIFYENNYYILVSDELNTHTTPDTSEHPYATRDKQDPQGENVPEFDFPTWGFRVLDKDAFIHLFDPVMEEEESEEEEIEDEEDEENESNFSNLDLHISLLDLFDEEILKQITSIELFHPFQKDETEVMSNGKVINKEGVEELTNQIFSTVSLEKAEINEDGKYVYQDDGISNINLYYKYFGSNLEKGLNLYILNFEDREFQLKIGDIIKCQKIVKNKSMIKQYNALVVGMVSECYIVQLENFSSISQSVNYIYDDEGNLIDSETKISDQFQIWSSEVIDNAKILLSRYPDYKVFDYARDRVHYCIQILLESEQEYYEDFLLDDTTTETDLEKIQIILGMSREEISYEEIMSNESFCNDFQEYTRVYPEVKDTLIKIGNIFPEESYDTICITSEELAGAYQDILSGINRPDYNVSYLVPSDETYGEDYHVAQIFNNSKLRIGDLSGIHDYTFKNHQPKSNGLYGRDVYLEGDFRLENGRSMKDIADDVDEIKSEIEHLEPINNSTIPILQGKILFKHDDVRYYNADGELSSDQLSYYDFDGTSYLHLGESSSMEELGGFFINQNVFNPTPQRYNNELSEDELSNVGGIVNKIGEDVYLINACEISGRSEEIMDDNLNESYRTYYYVDSTSDNKMHGKLLLGFGERWNTLFEQHGFNIYINITGGYTKTYGDSDITPDEETTSYDEKPLTVQINIVKNEQVSYQSYNSNTNKTIYESDVKFSYYAQLDLYEITGNRSNGDFYIQIMLMPQNS